MAVFCLRQSALMELKSKLRHRRTSAEKSQMSSHRYQHEVHARIMNMYLVSCKVFLCRARNLPWQ